MINNNATVTWDSCTFTDVNTFLLGGSNTSVDNTTFRRTGTITANGASITNCNIVQNRDAISITTSSLSNITKNNFISDGSNHAIELDSIGGGTMTWDNTSSGYVTGASGSPASTSSTGNETIFVNVGSGTLTINVADGASIPSIRTAGATVNVVAGLKTFTFNTLPSFTGYEWRIYEVTAIGSLTGSVEIAGEESAISSTNNYSYSYAADQPIAVQIISQPGADYEEEIRYFTLVNSNQSTTINLTIDNNN